jgi:hypothetical protein
VNYWPIQNNTLDIKGTAHLYNGVNATFTTDRFQNENSAIRLTYGYYQAPAGVYFSGDFTLSVWIRLTKIISWARIIDFGNGAASSNVALSSSVALLGQPFLYVFNSLSSNAWFTSTSMLQIGRWTHIACTLNGTMARVCLNAVCGSQSGFNQPANIIRSFNYVGKSNWPEDENLNADLDDLMIFNRSLSQSEIVELMRASLSSLVQHLPNVSIGLIQNTKAIDIKNSTFDFATLNLSQTTSLLSSKYDFGGCIVNCSNSGQCKFDSLNNKFICSCFLSYLSGSACQIDSRPCSSNPCLNNGTCVDNSSIGDYNSSSFGCVCGKYHRGTNCESEVDVCQNETCSSNGNCFDLKKKPTCKCFSMYSGERCESQSNELRIIKTVKPITSIIAVVVLVLFYVVFVLMDLTRLLWNKSKIRKSLNEPLVEKYYYVS